MSRAMASIVHPWVALQLTGNPAWVGVIIGLPAIIALGPTFIGGILADRFAKPRLLITTRVALGAVALFLALLAAREGLSIWYLFGLIVAGRSITALGFPAESTLVAEVTTEDELTSANAARNVVSETTEIAGAGLSGVVLAVAGPAAAFTVIGIIYLLSAAAMLFVKSVAPSTGDEEESSLGYKEALSYLRGSPLLQLLFILVFVDLFTVAVFPLLPIYADEVLGVGGAGFGLLMAGLSIGGVAAGVTLVKAGNSLSAPKAIVIGNVGWGVGMAGIAVSEKLVLTFVIVILMGAFSALAGVAWSSLALKAMPAEMRGRLFSIFNVAFQAFFVGALITGFIAAAIGIEAAMWIGAAGSVALPIIIWAASPTFRNAEGQ